MAACHTVLSCRKDTYDFEVSDSASHEKVKLRQLLGAVLSSCFSNYQRDL